jgi:hypothetical protein
MCSAHVLPESMASLLVVAGRKHARESKYRGKQAQDRAELCTHTQEEEEEKTDERSGHYARRKGLKCM